MYCCKDIYAHVLVPSMVEEPHRTEKRMKPRDWRFMGEVDARSRPRNSLAASVPVEYEKARCAGGLSSKEDKEILKLLKERVRERRFDNFEYSVIKKEEAQPEDAVEHKDAGQEMERDQLEKLFLEIKNELDVLTNVCGVWHCSDIRMYEEKHVVPEEKEPRRSRGRDTKSMRVLKKAKNVKILK